MRKLFLLPVALIIAFAAATMGEPASSKHSSPPGRPVARRWLSSLTLRQKVAQLVIIPFYGEAPNTRSKDYRKFLHLVGEEGVGGLILVNHTGPRGIRRAEPYALAAFINRMQRIARIPLIVGGDFERGASMRVNGTTLFPHAMTFAAAQDTAATRYMGEVTARDSRAMGIQWVFFPDADVNSNPDNPIINIRSFGENPAVVSEHVRAYIEGARADPKVRVLTTAKHFPGHGDTSIDSHVQLSSISSDRAHLEKIEFVPFRAAIEAGVDAVMTAHIAAPAIDAPDIPATLSSAIMTGLLRNDLKFNGLIVTDALEMGGVAKVFSTGEVAVRAIQAGADVLLMPPDPEAAIRAVVAAVQQGRLTTKRIEDSVVRLLAAKQAVGLDVSKLVDLEAISDVIDSPEAAAKAQEITDRGVTLVKNDGGAFPPRDPRNACYVILAEGRYSNEGGDLTRELKSRGVSSLFSLDPTLPDSELDATAQKAAACQEVAVLAFASVGAYKGNLSLPGEFPKLIETLIANGRPITLVSLGNPYLIRSFPTVAAYLTTYTPVTTAEISIAKALFGEIDIGGHLPVTIPGIADYGFGISLPRRSR